MDAIEPGESHLDLKGMKIEDMTAKQLYKYASYYNWDGGCRPLVKVIRHPKCDRGTARLIYWRGEPSYACQFTRKKDVNDFYRETYALLIEIEKRMAEGAYKKSAIPFDPRDDDGTDWTDGADVEAMKREIPACMYAE